MGFLEVLVMFSIVKAEILSRIKVSMATEQDRPEQLGKP